MKQYFSWDSSIFTFITLLLIIIGSPIWLMIFSVLTIIFLIYKAKLFMRCEGGGNCILILLILPLIFFGTAF